MQKILQILVQYISKFLDDLDDGHLWILMVVNSSLERAVIIQFSLNMLYHVSDFTNQSS